MRWIESHIALGDHPKLRRLCRYLGVSDAQAVGHLHYLWWAAVRYAPDGDLSSFELDEIADFARWDGEGSDLVEALVGSGFLEDDLTIHDWEDHAGRATQASDRSSKAGSLGNHIRWHLERSVVEPSCPHCSGGDRDPNRGAIGGDSPPESHIQNRQTDRQNSKPKEIGGRSGGDQFAELCRAIAEEQADEREASGYEIRSRPAFVAKLALSEEVRNQARKRLAPDQKLRPLLEGVGQTIPDDERKIS